MSASDLPLRLDDLIAHVLDRRPDGVAARPAGRRRGRRRAPRRGGGPPRRPLRRPGPPLGRVVDRHRRAWASQAGRAEALRAEGGRASRRADRPGFGRFTPRARHVVDASHERARQARPRSSRHRAPRPRARRRARGRGRWRSCPGRLARRRRPGGHRAARPAPADGRARARPLRPRAKKALELSFREALRRGHNDIGTEHILLAMLDAPDDVAAHVLVALGVEPAPTAAWITDQLARTASSARP